MSLLWALRITPQTILEFQHLPASDRRLAALSAYIRQSNRVDGTPQLSSSNWHGFAEQHLHTSVHSKMRRLLQYIEERSAGPGDRVAVYGGKDYPLFDAASSAEVRFLLDALIERNDIKAVDGQDRFFITPQGWETLEPSRGGGVAGACFVAMSFDEDLVPAYQLGIKPAVRVCGFPDVRVDRVEHANNINDEIISGIRRAKFLVADFTNHRGGVYFEAGFGLGLGKLVIWTCRNDHFSLDKVHFDTRPYNHIVWSTEWVLYEKLVHRIRALVPDAKQA